jgi:hypothetical protein
MPNYLIEEEYFVIGMALMNYIWHLATFDQQPIT